MFNKKFILITIFIVGLFSISAVSAADNITVDGDSVIDGEVEMPTERLEIKFHDDENYSDYDYDDYDFDDYDDYDDDKEKIQIIAQDLDLYYSKVYSYIVSLVDENGDFVYDVDELKVTYDDGDVEIGEFDDDGGYYLFSMDKIGNRKATITLTDSYYTADPVTISLNISKSSVKITTKNYYSNTKQYSILKAIVKDADGEPIEKGKVKFDVNGKSYYVNVVNGVATKKIKLTKAKTYTYSATYVGNDYYNDSNTSSSNIFVYSSSKKARTFTVKGYRFTLTQNQYNKLINAKNIGKTLIYKVKTNKEIKQTVKKVSYSYKWKYVKTVDLVYAHEKCYYDSNYRYDTIIKHWINDGVYYQTCKLYKKVQVEKVSYKKVNSRVYARIGYALNGQAGHDTYWIEIMTNNFIVVKGKLHWEVKSTTLPGLKTAKPIDMKNFSMK